MAAIDVAPEVEPGRPDSIFHWVVPSTECGCVHGGKGRNRTTRPDNIAGGLPAETKKLLDDLTTTPNECAEDVDRAPGAPCSSKKMIGAITEFIQEKHPDASTGVKSAHLPTATTTDAATVRGAAAALGCDSESCVITHPSLRSFIVDQNIMSRRDIKQELDLRYKAAGPRDNVNLLSNVHLDETLRRWARVFPEFFPCPFAMIDFDRNGDYLGRVDLPKILRGEVSANLGPGIGHVRRKFTCFGCIVNTDVSSGPGKHWVELFVDARPPPGEPWTVEYFNSAGNPPPKAIVKWMERTRDDLARYRATLPGCEDKKKCPVESISVTSVDHQDSQTECGVYTLYYIRRRLEGTSYKFFFEEFVPDAAMTAFRAHIFRHTK